MKTDKLRALRRQTAELHGGRGRRYPASLRQQVVAVAANARDEGWSFERIGDAVGVSHASLRRWCADEVGASEPVLAPVDIEADAVAVGGGLSVLTPSGFRVDGLDVDGAARLIRALS